jgi:sugar phosphate isomerase/epimerase
MGNWSAAPHADLQSLLQSKEKRQEFLSVLEQNGLSLAALNCSGNQLHPVDGERQSKPFTRQFRLPNCLACKPLS